MCGKVACKRCGLVTWQGCGRHVDKVLREVPMEARCRDWLTGFGTCEGRPPLKPGEAPDPQEKLVHPSPCTFAVGVAKGGLGDAQAFSARTRGGIQTAHQVARALGEIHRVRRAGGSLCTFCTDPRPELRFEFLSDVGEPQHVAGDGKTAESVRRIE